jgi:glycerophosphoryl diester phosphodiesterase
MAFLARWVKRLVVALPAITLLLGAYLIFPWPMPAAASFTLIAHRGVHQTFPLAGLTNETCTAARIDPPAHQFIENTLPSMRAAFAAGATAVELDIHRTADGQLAVFHDWTLDCRTDGTGVTNQQTLAALQRLDLGYGYTADGGATFPLRGTGVGMLPALPDVLAAFPGEQLVIDDKDGDGETAALLADYLATLPREDRARLSYWGGDASFALIREGAPEVQRYIAGRREVRACLGDYLFRMLFTGQLPERCRETIIGIPYGLLPAIPGWPNLILARAHQAGALVVVTDVDSPEQLAAIAGLPLDGIQTHRIEVIGPLLADRVAGSAGA